MHVICRQKPLLSALSALGHMTSQELSPQAFRILFKPGQETLTLLGMGMEGMVGGVCSLPAHVKQEGQALVPLEPLREYVEALQAEATLTLSHQQEALPWKKPPKKGRVEPDFPFEVEGISTSEGRTLTYHARMKAEQADASPLPPPQALAPGNEGAMLPVALLLPAVRTCASLVSSAPVREQGVMSQMDGILICLGTQALELYAAAGTSLAGGSLLLSYRLPWRSPLAGPIGSGLFVGKALAWICKALAETKEDEPLTLQIAQEQSTHRPVLLVSTSSHAIWFCRSLGGVSLPTIWRSTLHLPHTTTFQIQRSPLLRSLAFFAKTTASQHAAGMALTLREATLGMRLVTVGEEAIEGQQELPLAAPAATDLDVLVNPQQFRQLVRAVPDPLLQIEVGQFEREEEQGLKTVTFLRASSQDHQVTVMMGLSRLEAAESEDEEGVSA